MFPFGGSSHGSQLDKISRLLTTATTMSLDLPICAESFDSVNDAQVAAGVVNFTPSNTHNCTKMTSDDGSLSTEIKDTQIIEKTTNLSRFNIDSKALVQSTSLDSVVTVGMSLELIHPIKQNCFHSALITDVSDRNTVHLSFEDCYQNTGLLTSDTVKDLKSQIDIAKGFSSTECGSSRIKAFSDGSTNKYVTTLDDFRLLPTGFCSKYKFPLHPLKSIKSASEIVKRFPKIDTDDIKIPLESCLEMFDCADSECTDPESVGKYSDATPLNSSMQACDVVLPKSDLDDESTISSQSSKLSINSSMTLSKRSVSEEIIDKLSVITLQSAVKSEKFEGCDSSTLHSPTISDSVTLVPSLPSAVLAELSSIPVLNKDRDASSLGFHAGQKLEIVNPQDSGVLCVASISHVAEHLLWIKMDSKYHSQGKYSFD